MGLQPSGLRVLGRLRLSVASDESTAIERQREVITSWAEANGHTVVGWAEDIISGGVNPFDTKQFGDWLKNQAAEFDVIATWRLDRLCRNAIRLNVLIKWCLDHDKTLVSCSESIDIGTPVGRLIANVIGFLAEGEREAMRERQVSSRGKLRSASRWPGGKPPYGYQIADSPNGVGKVLVIDPLAHKVVRRIVDAVLAGVPLSRIVGDLNREGVVSPADHHRVCNGQEDTGSPWRTGPLKHLLLSPTLVGYAHLGGVTVWDDQNNPVVMAAEPLVTDDEKELIAEALAQAEGAPRERGLPAALIGISTCYFCGTPLTTTRQSKTVKGGVIKHYVYYRCPIACSSLIPAEDAEALAEDTFMRELGDRDVTKRVWVRGNQNAISLRRAVAAFDDLSKTAGMMTSRTAKDRLQRRLAALDAQIAELESTPIREGRYEDRPTGEKYRDLWNRETDPVARRDLLKLSEITFRIAVTTGGSRRSKTDGGSWYVDVRSPYGIDEAAVAAERQRWGVPG